MSLPPPLPKLGPYSQLPQQLIHLQPPLLDQNVLRELYSYQLLLTMPPLYGWGQKLVFWVSTSVPYPLKKAPVLDVFIVGIMTPWITLAKHSFLVDVHQIQTTLKQDKNVWLLASEKLTQQKLLE